MMSQGPTAAASPDFMPVGDDSDDLPRTFRREKEARAREARERAAQERAAAPALPHGSEPPSIPAPQVYASSEVRPDLSEDTFPATVRAFDVPFFHLMTFFLKAVVAALPALILLTVILWFMGAALQAFFPSLVKMKILLSFPNG